MFAGTFLQENCWQARPGVLNRMALWRVSLQTGAGQGVSPPVEFGGKDEGGLFNVSQDGQFLIFSRNGSAIGHIWILDATNGVF